MTNEEPNIEHAHPSDEPVTETHEQKPPPSSSGRPKRIGQYRIKRAIASGGMGTVYEALQEKPRRTVAVKVMRQGIASRSALRRFDYEAQLLARLRHNAIAQVYDAGTHRDGEVTVPYFAMEYIVGAKAVTDYAKEKKLGTRERMKLFADVCEAVHHGHQKGIIHRDLKPSNILVDSSGQVKIIDFGVARSTDSDMAVTTLQTDVGQLIGTLQYMSPEQCAADPHDIDTRSDVYALGVILFEMLCERMPYEIKGAAIHEATRVIREQEPTRLSALNKTLRGDVETIALKALEKDRDRRYQSASALVADIGRYLNNEAISARPASAMYQFRKLVSRHKAPFAFVAVLFLLISGFGIWMSVMYTHAERLRQDAVAAEQAHAVARRDAEDARGAEEAQRKLAEQREAEAVTARAETQARADELKTVTEFQQSMLSDMDTEAMGRDILERVADGVSKFVQASGTASDENDERIVSLRASLKSVNGTNIALGVVNDHVLKRAIEAIDRDLADQPVVQAQLLQTVSDTLRSLGLYDTAADPQRRAVTIRRNVLGDDHPDTLTSINLLGILLQAQGKLDEAMPYYHEALEGKRRVLGDDHPSTLASIGSMGHLLQAQGKLDEAMPYLREALEGQRRVLGDDHPDTLTAINNMASLLKAQGKGDEATPYHLEALEGKRRVLGDDHASTLMSINNMGHLLQTQGKLDEAMPYLREALEGNRRVLGDDHANTLNSINNMGNLLQAQGKLDEAFGYYREALEGNRRVLGDDHPKTLMPISNMGHLLLAQGKLDEAMPYLREAFEGYRRVLGENHPRTLVATNNLGHQLNLRGRYNEAAEILETGEPAARRVWTGGNAWRVGNYLSKLGEAQIGLGDFSKADETLVEAHTLLAAGLGGEHDRTKKATSLLIKLFDAWHAAEPGKGYDAKAAEWRAKLEEVATKPQSDEATEGNTSDE